MAGEDNYNGRRPSFGRTKQGEPIVRGYRSRPGAPQHDPTSNAPLSRDSRTPQSNWDSLFRNTISNDFGATGGNPSYISTFPSPAASPAPSTIQEMGYDPGGMAQLEALAGGGLSHAQQWSQPQPRMSFASNAWEAPSKTQTGSILDRYSSKRGNLGFGWGSAFSNNTPGGRFT